MKRLPCRTLFLLTAVCLAVIVPFCFYGERVNAWTGQLIGQAEAHRFAVGAALTLLLASDILMPVPSSLASTACGMTLGFLGGAAASFIGMTVSAAAGYLIGRYASGAANRMIGADETAMLKTFQERQGVWVLLALRPVPVLAEASVVFSGLSRQPFPQMLAVTSLGNAAVSLVYAAVGAWGRLSDSFLPAFGASMLLSGVFFFGLRRRRVTPCRRPPA